MKISLLESTVFNLVSSLPNANQFVKAVHTNWRVRDNMSFENYPTSSIEGIDFRNLYKTVVSARFQKYFYVVLIIGKKSMAAVYVSRTFPDYERLDNSKVMPVYKVIVSDSNGVRDMDFTNKNVNIVKSYLKKYIKDVDIQQIYYNRGLIPTKKTDVDKGTKESPREIIFRIVRPLVFNTLNDIIRDYKNLASQQLKNNHFVDAGNSIELIVAYERLLISYDTPSTEKYERNKTTIMYIISKAIELTAEHLGESITNIQNKIIQRNKEVLLLYVKYFKYALIHAN